MSLSYTKTGVGSLPEQGGNPRTLTGRPAGPGPAGAGSRQAGGPVTKMGVLGAFTATTRLQRISLEAVPPPRL